MIMAPILHLKRGVVDRIQVCDQRPESKSVNTTALAQRAFHETIDVDEAIDRRNEGGNSWSLEDIEKSLDDGSY